MLQHSPLCSARPGESALGVDAPGVVERGQHVRGSEDVTRCEDVALRTGDKDAAQARVGTLQATSLAAAEIKYTKGATTSETNAELCELQTYARGEAAACVLDLRKIERFITLHVPKVEDGNNFGVAIQLEVAYFAPSPRLHKTLRRAVLRGTDLALITNSQATMDVPFVAAASRAEFRRLLRLSPEAALYEWQVLPGWETLHSKVAAFGDCGPVIVGSSNLDGLSIERNSESIVLIEDAALRAEFQTIFGRDLDLAEPVDIEALAAPVWVRGFEWMIIRFGWFLL